MANSTGNTAGNVISGICIGLGWGYCMVLFAVSSLWFAKAPGTPDPLHGLIYPHNEHGGIRYFSAAQTLAENMQFCVFPIFFLGVLISPKKNMTRRLMGARWDRDDPYNIGAITAISTVAIVGISVWFVWPEIMGFLLALGLQPFASS